jgi:hypothetical protein
MKTPRVNDFDPNAKVSTLKSSMETMPVIEKPATKDGEVSRDSAPPYPVPYGVPRPVPPMKRRMRQRQPFDVFEDQYATLKKIAEDEREQGLPGSMSRMVREGIDMYLAAKKKRGVS